jgi:MFS family permease
MVLWMSFIGGAIGCFVSGCSSDDFGRKRLIMLGDMSFMVGILIASLPTNLYCLFIGRFFAGFGVGSQMCLTPLFLSEISPIEIRGKMVVACVLQFGVG